MKTVKIRCYSDTFNYITIKFYRERENEKTYYRALVRPVNIIDLHNGFVREQYVCFNGYKCTLCSCHRASNKMLEVARQNLVTFITEAMRALDNNGLTPAPFDAFDIAQKIDCEVL